MRFVLSQPYTKTIPKHTFFNISCYKPEVVLKNWLIFLGVSQVHTRHEVFKKFFSNQLFNWRLWNLTGFIEEIEVLISAYQILKFFALIWAHLFLIIYLIFAVVWRDAQLIGQILSEYLIITCDFLSLI